MSSPTATIRVPRATRDELARRADERGISLSALLTEFADEQRRIAAFRSERDAQRLDAANDDVRTEIVEWDTVLDDGVD